MSNYAALGELVEQIREASSNLTVADAKRQAPRLDRGIGQRLFKKTQRLSG